MSCVSLLPCGHLLVKGLPRGSCLWCLVVFLSLSHVVSVLRCGTWLYRFLIFAAFLTLVLTYYKFDAKRIKTHTMFSTLVSRTSLHDNFVCGVIKLHHSTFYLKTYKLKETKSRLATISYIIYSNISLCLEAWYLSRCPLKGTSRHACPSKTQISLRIRTVWSESSMGALWVAKDPRFYRWKTKTLIRLWGCADWFQSSLYVHANLYLKLGTGSIL